MSTQYPQIIDDATKIPPSKSSDSPNVTEKFSTGIRLVYRYTNDTRGVDDVSGTDWGGSLWGRYFIKSGLFAQAEYEYLNYEFGSFDEDFQSVLGGFGYHRPGFAIPRD